MFNVVRVETELDWRATWNFGIETFRTKSELEVVRDFWSSAHAHRDADFEFYQFIGELFPHIVRPHVIAVYRDGEPKALILGRLENRSLDIRVGYWRLRTRKLRTLTIVHGGVVGDPRDEDCEAVMRHIIHSLRAGEAVLARFKSLAVEISSLCARDCNARFRSFGSFH